MTTQRYFVRMCTNVLLSNSQVKISLFAAGSKYFSTSTLHFKKTPQTIGVMSWVRAARRRRYLEQKMKDTIKSEHAIIKEEEQARMEPQIEFRTTSRRGDFMNEDVMCHQHIKPEVLLSTDKKTIICFHPPPKPYPENFTKRAVGPSLFGMNDKLIGSFKDDMTEEQISEALQLREQDPRAWNSNSLAKLFKVKPEIVNTQAPMNKQQMKRAIAEREIYHSMSVMKRENFRQLQKWERLKYIRSTRSGAFAQWYQSLDERPKPKAYVPPKF